MKLFRNIIIGALGLLISAPALALEPSKTTLVTSYEPSVPAQVKQEDETIFMGISECERGFGGDGRAAGTFVTTVDPNGPPESSVKHLDAVYQFFVDRGTTADVSCPDACERVDDDENVNTGEDFVRGFRDFGDFVGFDTPDGCSGFDREYFFRMTIWRNPADMENLDQADVRFIIDTQRPTPPSNVQATTTENQLEVTWEPADDDDIQSYGVYWSTTEFTGGELPSSDLSSAFFTAEGGRTSGTANVNFEPGQTVYYAMVSSDETANNSVLSAVSTTTVIETNDFWDTYQNAGGAEEGGCSTTNGGGSSLMLVLLALVGFVVRRRR